MNKTAVDRERIARVETLYEAFAAGAPAVAARTGGLDAMTIVGIDDAPMIGDMFHPHDWGGVNEAHLLETRKLGRIAHATNSVAVTDPCRTASCLAVGSVTSRRRKTEGCTGRPCLARHSLGKSADDARLGL